MKKTHKKKEPEKTGKKRKKASPSFFVSGVDWRRGGGRVVLDGAVLSEDGLELVAIHVIRKAPYVDARLSVPRRKPGASAQHHDRCGEVHLRLESLAPLVA